MAITPPKITAPPPGAVIRPQNGTFTLRWDASEVVPDEPIEGGAVATILAPLPGSTRTVGTPTSIEAVVDAEDVTGVEFLVNGASVGSATFEAHRNRWTLAWTPDAAGPITVQAKATTAAGEVQSSPVPVQLELPAPPPTGSLVEFTDPRVAFILAPQVYAGDGKMDGTSATTDRVPWPFVDANMETAGRTVTSMFLSTPPVVWYGTGENGKFIADAPTWQPDELVGHPIVLRNDGGGTIRSGVFVTANTETTVFFNADATGARSLYVATTGTSEYHQSWAREWHYYYDLGLVAWQCYYRTNDPWWRDQAIRVTRSFHKFWEKPSPRSSAISGQILTAMYEDGTLTGEGPGGRSLMWDKIFQYVEGEGFVWVWRPYNLNRPPIGVRDPGYMTLYMAQLAYMLPDTYYATSRDTGAFRLNMLGIYDAKEVGDLVTNGALKRQLLREKLAEVVSGYPGSSHGLWGKLQTPDGGWRQGEEDQSAADGDYSMPFHGGLLAEGLIAVHRLLSEYPEHAGVVAELEATLARHAGYQWFVGYQIPGTPNGTVLSHPNERWRSTVFMAHSDNAARGNRFEGTVTLTQGSKQVTGSGTKFLTEADHYGLRLFFDQAETGKIELTMFSTTAVGSEGMDFTRYLPGQVLWTNTPNEHYFRAIRIKQIVSATEAVLYELPRSEMCGAPLTVIMPPHQPLPGEWTVDKATNTITSADAHASTDGLQVGDTAYSWLEVVHECTIVQITKPTEPINAGRISIDIEVEEDTSTIDFNQFLGATWFEFTSGPNTGVRRRASTALIGQPGVNQIRFSGSAGSDKAPLPFQPQAGDTVRVHRITLDRWVINEVNGSKSFSASSINSNHHWKSAKTRVVRFSREGEPLGAFLVDRVDSDTQLTLQQPWPGPTISGIRVRQDVGTARARSSDANAIRDARHQSSTIGHVLGWMYVHSGDPVWKDRVEEVASSLFGKGVGPGADNYYGLQDYITPNSNRRGKEWNETMRASAKMLGYRLGGS